MSRDIIIAPSLLAANALNIGEEVEKIEKGGAKWLHLDIMDGHFVPNLSFSPTIVKSIRPMSDMFFDVHLMMTNPEKYIDAFADAGADLITVHYEIADKDTLRQMASYIHSKGIKAGISVKPKTDIKETEDILDAFDLILIMTVEPGFGGQSYMADMEPKMEWARAMTEKYPDLDIEVDGGIGEKTIKGAAMAGANVFVAGSSVFGAKDAGAEVVKLTELARV